MLTVYSRQQAELDIVTTLLDPALSPYATMPCIIDYVGKVRRLKEYLQFDGTFAWAVTEERLGGMPMFDERKPWQWKLAVDESRIVGFVRSALWDKHLKGEGPALREAATKAADGEDLTALVAQPIAEGQVVEIQLLSERFPRGRIIVSAVRSYGDLFGWRRALQ